MKLSTTILSCTNDIHWQEGKRLGQLMETCCVRLDSHPAIEIDNQTLSYSELNESANQLARYLLSQGIQSGDRVGLLLDKSFDAYITLLAVLKINATYVPFDASFPADRINFMVEDAAIKTILTLSHFQSQLSDATVPLLLVDTVKKTVNIFENNNLSDNETCNNGNKLCYIIYTSGTTGKPKGVEIEHDSVVNFVTVAAKTYGYTKNDRVYQGLTLAFDFAVEELLLPLYVGATLVVPPQDNKLLGSGLESFLRDKKITALCCVPTLLATIESNLPDLCLLILSGESCPQDLVNRWCHEDRRILNVYGPTEATVTATWTELKPNKAVTIGKPLPGYTVVILDPDNARVVGQGGEGEIAIAGVGLAKGYLNLPERTQESFIPDFLNLPNNPSKRLYRTGDLGRINNDGNIECIGRIDSQVKLRGYRIELGEIESQIMQVPGVAQAVVDVYEPEQGNKQLAAYYSLKPYVDTVSAGAIYDEIKGQLPSYMRPDYYQLLDTIPLTNNDKADRKALPVPIVERFIVEAEYTAPSNRLETQLAAKMAAILNVEKVSTTSNFFEELGAHSLLMTLFCSQVLNELGVAITISHVYQNPTIQKLAECLASQQHKSATEHSEKQRPLHKPSTFSYYLCGSLQLLSYAVFTLLSVAIIFGTASWALEATTPGELFIRTTSITVVVFLGGVLLSVGLKWLLIGRWTVTTVPVWSLSYFRFWLVKLVVTLNPIVVFKGTPLYIIYLRLLGAKIGKNVVIESNLFPVCTDLLSIGDDTVLDKDSIVTCYKAEGNIIYTGRVIVGSDCYVGEGSVLDINTTMDDGAQLGHTSCLYENDNIPMNKCYHGSPAEETSTHYKLNSTLPSSLTRKVIYSCMQLSGVCFLPALLLFIANYLFADIVITTASNVENASSSDLILASTQIMSTLWLSIGVVFGGLLLQLVSATIVPRLLNPLLKENHTYPLYGFHYLIFQIIRVSSNSKTLNVLFGDSSLIVYYLKLIGYDMRNIIQTGSNFGLVQKHDNPLLCEIGSGTIVSDGLSMMNARKSSTEFILQKVVIGENTFIGNGIFYPADATVKSGCLLGTKALIPIDGPERVNETIIGSPSYSVLRNSTCDDPIIQKYQDSDLRAARICKKNWHNFMTAVSFLSYSWAYTFFTLLFLIIEVKIYQNSGVLAASTSLGVFYLLSIIYFLVIGRISLYFGSIKAQTISVYDGKFWKVEYFWKHTVLAPPILFKGTPFKNIISRLSGVKIGKKVFDNGMGVAERSLVEIGDYATLNDSCVLQCHTLEDLKYTSGLINIGSGCTIGVSAFVNYSVEIGEGTIIKPDSFIMKGSTAEPNTIWGGNPAGFISIK